MRRFNQAQRHRVDRDVVAPEFTRQRLAQRNAAGAGSSAQCNAVLANPRRIARQRDDAAAVLLDHVRRNRVASVDRAVQANVDLLLPGFRRAVDEALGNHIACIVDQDIDAAEFGNDVSDHLLYFFVAADVGLVGARVAAGLFDFLDHFLCLGTGAVVIDGNGSTVSRQRERNFATDVTAGTSYQCYFSTQIGFHEFSSLLLIGAMRRAALAALHLYECFRSAASLYYESLLPVLAAYPCCESLLRRFAKSVCCACALRCCTHPSRFTALPAPAGTVVLASSAAR